jgi:peptidoglycan/xylan/chitin deacetylase (PgdA/CDA1 family)
METNHIDRVILIHDIDLSKRMGMQKHDSRFLVSWDIIDKAIEDSKNKSITFEPLILNDTNKHIKNFVRFTVDDGGGSSIEIAKYLEKMNIKAYFFIPTKFIGKDGFLQKEEIKELYEIGHIIG